MDIRIDLRLSDSVKTVEAFVASASVDNFFPVFLMYMIAILSRLSRIFSTNCKVKIRLSCLLKCPTRRMTLRRY